MTRPKNNPLAGAARCVTLGDWLRFAEKLYAREQLALGQVADSAHDEALYLLLHAMGLPLDSSARVLAQFHYLAHDFVPGDLAREQPPIMQMMRELQGAFRGFAAASRGTAFDQRFLDELPRIQELLARGGTYSNLHRIQFATPEPTTA